VLRRDPVERLMRHHELKSLDMTEAFLGSLKQPCSSDRTPSGSAAENEKPSLPRRLASSEFWFLVQILVFLFK
jgi:hypothetical protein